MLKLKRIVKKIAKKNLSYINKQINPEKHQVVSSLINFVSRPLFRSTVVNYFLNRREIMMKVERHVPLPRNLYFEGTNICNADCVFCPYTRMERPKKTMSMDFFRNIVDQYVAMGGRAIGFTPIVGDPMVDKFLLDRLAYLDSLNQITNVGFYTNGIALTPEKIERLVEFKNTTINLNISFGGHDRMTFQKMMGVDRFHLVEKNVLHLLDVLETKGHERLIVKIDFRCQDPKNPDPFGRRVHECISNGLLRMDSLEGSYDTFGGFMTQADLDRAGLGLSMDYGYPKFGPCEIPFTKPIVLADGRLNACAERDLEADLTIGDLTQENLKDLLYGPRMREFVRKFYEPHLLPEVCKKCTVYQSVYNPKAKVWKEDLNWIVARDK